MIYFEISPLAQFAAQRSSSASKEPLNRWIYKAIFAKAQRIVAISEVSATDLEQILTEIGFPKSKDWLLDADSPRQIWIEAAIFESAARHGHDEDGLQRSFEKWNLPG